MIDDRSTVFDLPLPHVTNKGTVDNERLRAALVLIDSLLNERESVALKNVANGYAGLDENGRVLAVHMPTDADDVREFDTVGLFPGAGEIGKVYLATDTPKKIFRWDAVGEEYYAATPATTDDLEEGPGSLFYTAARIAADFAARSTDDLAEGPGSLYYTDDRVSAAFAARSTDDLPEGVGSLYFTSDRVKAAQDHDVESGTSMLFVQTAAPTGWTKSTTHNNKALRVVSGGAGSGGTHPFTTAFAIRSITGSVGNTTLDMSQMPYHSHGISTRYADGGTNADGSAYAKVAVTGNLASAKVTEPLGSSAAHTHSLTVNNADFSVQYVDTIIATKD